LALAAGVLLAAWALAGYTDPAPESLAQAPTERPNIIVVMTDDQDAASLRVMEIVRRRLTARGTRFGSFYATFPLCCPSRATYLTGQYAHNHGVLGNGHYAAFDDSSTLAVALDRAGYRTALVGKYLNGYEDEDPPPIPPGWDDWYAITGDRPVRLFNWELTANGTIRHYGSGPRDYQTDVLGRIAARLVRESAPQPQPLFLTLATGAPHEDGRGGGPTPAPRHGGAFADEPFPTSPSWNEDDVTDKPSFIQELPELGENRRLAQAERHRNRLASLLAVDEAVGRVMDALRASGELSSTLVVFTSDNGYYLGEHRLHGKEKLYEEAARVPMVMRGPGVPAAATLDQLAGNVDLAPTILDAADVAPLEPVDGHSLLPLAEDPTIEWRGELLLENRGSAAIRTPDHMYAEHPGGEVELYDVHADPFQLGSLHHDAAQSERLQDLSERLAEIRDCGAGAMACP
jgi:arylsulfatase A-like enzyme